LCEIVVVDVVAVCDSDGQRL